MMQQTPIYIIASPRPRVGKTLLARLLIEFFRSSDRPLIGYDLNPRDPALTSRFPDLVWTVDITDTRGQMALFDRLIADHSSTKVIDLGYAAFDTFFSVMAEIGFVQEARRRAIDPVVLFVTDSAATTVERLRRAAAPARTDHIRAHAQRSDVGDVRQEGFPVDARRMRRHPHTPPLADRPRRHRPAEFLVSQLHDRASRADRPKCIAGSAPSSPNFANSSCGC